VINAFDRRAPNGLDLIFGLFAMLGMAARIGADWGKTQHNLPNAWSKRRASKKKDPAPLATIRARAGIGFAMFTSNFTKGRVQ
jgi:hypothetical protein